MKTAVIYFTKTGHSKKIAEAIANELNVEAEDVSTSPKLCDVDLLYIVGGIYAGQSDPCMLEYVKSIDSTLVKKAVLLTSCVSKRFKQEMVRKILQENNTEVMHEEYVCQGALGFIGRKHPDEKDLLSAVEFVRGRV